MAGVESHRSTPSAVITNHQLRAAPNVAEAEAQHGPAGWDGVQVNVAVDVPHQQVRVQVLVPEDGHPAGAPLPESLDDRAQLLAAGVST